MFLNLAAAWKDLNLQLEDDGLSEETIEVRRREFYCGAGATLLVQRNIARAHSGEAADILLTALDDEIDAFLDEVRAEA